MGIVKCSECNTTATIYVDKPCGLVPLCMSCYLKYEQSKEAPMGEEVSAQGEALDSAHRQIDKLTRENVRLTEYMKLTEKRRQFANCKLKHVCEQRDNARQMSALWKRVAKHFYSLSRLIDSSAHYTSTLLDESESERDALAARVAELEALIDDVDGPLYWLLNLVHGNSRGGPEYNPPSNAEWALAWEEAQSAHEKVVEYRKAKVTGAPLPFEDDAGAHGEHAPDHERGGLDPLSADNEHIQFEMYVCPKCGSPVSFYSMMRCIECSACGWTGQSLSECDTK